MNTTALSPTRTLAEITLEHPRASRVFHRHRLDFCCGGRRPLEEACREKALDPTTVLDDLRRELDRESADATSWAERPLGELIDFILRRYHEPLREELPELVAMARKVEAVHGDKASCPVGLADLLAAMHEATLVHLLKEEQVLFPLVREGRGSECKMAVQVLEADHADHGATLDRIRELTDDLTPPEEACTTWRTLYGRLVELEHDLMEHIHLENNLLFPRALFA